MESSVLDGDLRIGDFVVRPLLKVVRPVSGGVAAEEQTLPDKAMAVLVYLAQHARQVCDRDDILDAVWGPEREAYDRVLDNAIREIRRALNDDARSPSYIQTIPKRGYRLLVPVESRLLQKQRDASGEFVPVPKDASVSVFQRVRRQARPPRNPSSSHEALDPASARHAPGQPSGPRSDLTSEQIRSDRSRSDPALDPLVSQHASPPGDSGRHATAGPPRGDRRTLLGLGATAAMILLLAAWSFGRVEPDLLTVSIDAGDLSNADSAVAAAPDRDLPEATLTEDVVTTALRRQLFEEHACGDRNLYRPRRLLGRKDFEIHLGGTGGTAGEAADSRPILAAEIRPAVTNALVLLDVARDPGSSYATAEGFAREVVRELDHAACRSERAADLGRACHCLQAGRTIEATSNLQDTIEDLELAITLDPELVPAYAALAQAFQGTGNFDHGLSVLKTGLAKIEDPDSTEALGLRLQLARLLEDPAEEERLLEKLRRRHPEDPRWILAQAAFLAQHRRQCEEALELLEPLMSQRPRVIPATLEGSSALWMCGETDRVVELVTEQVEQLPREVGLRKWLAAILSLTGGYQQAADYAKEAMALEPDSADPYWILGMVSDRQGHYAAAEAWYLKSAELARWPRQRIRAGVGQARVAWLRGEYDRCLEVLGKIPEAPYLDSYESPTWLRGLCLADAGRLDEARQALQEMTASLAGQASASRDAQQLHLRGKIELAEADSPAARQRAAETFIEAAEARPLRIDFVCSETGQALMEAGDAVRAEEWLSKALKVNPNHPWSLCRLGLLRQGRGEVDSAVASLRRGVEVFGPRSEDPLAARCAEALSSLRPETTEASDPSAR